MNRLSSILFIILIFSSLHLPAQTKRALVIGIGEQKDKNWSKINGDKDVPYVQRMLMKAEYKNVMTLINKQATKAGIVTAFKRLTLL